MLIEDLNDLKRSGYNFLSLLNDIKRRPEDAAKELGISERTLYRKLKEFEL